MHRPSGKQPSATLITMTTTLTALLLAPLTMMTRWAAKAATRFRDEEDGMSEIVSGLLWVAGAALIVIVVLSIIQPWAENEASNLPTSGT